MKRNEPISRIMSTDLITAHVGQKLSELRALLSEGNFHHLPVVSGDKLVGLVTSSDILRASFGRTDSEIDSTLDHTAQLENIMQKNPATIEASASVRNAAEKLATGAFHCLPVVEGQKLVGMVTSTDLIRYLVDQY